MLVRSVQRAFGRGGGIVSASANGYASMRLQLQLSGRIRKIFIRNDIAEPREELEAAEAARKIRQEKKARLAELMNQGQRHGQGQLQEADNFVDSEQVPWLHQQLSEQLRRPNVIITTHCTHCTLLMLPVPVRDR